MGIAWFRGLIVRGSVVTRDRCPFPVRSESVYVCGAGVRRKSVYVRFLPVRESDLSPCSVRWKGVGDCVGRGSHSRMGV